EHRHLHSFPTRRSSDLENSTPQSLVSVLSILSVEWRTWATCSNRRWSPVARTRSDGARSCGTSTARTRFFRCKRWGGRRATARRSEEHTSELQSRENLV